MSATSPIEWDPRAEDDKLAALARVTAAMHHGRAAFEQRLGELGGGYPSKGDGGHSGSSSDGGPTAKAVEAKVDEHRTDVADLERIAWERDLAKALDDAAKLWDRHKRIVHRRIGVPALKDPGCELCAKVPCGDPNCRCSAIDGRHWCPVRYTIEVTEKAKGGKATVRLVGVCSSCYEFQRPDAAGRLPDHGEVLDHVEGKKRRWKVKGSTR